MKRCFVVGACAILLTLGASCPLSCVGQGTVAFSNYGALGRITNGLSGALVEVGTRFLVNLYFAQDGVVDEAQFVSVGEPIGIVPTPGYFNDGVRTAPTSVYGGYGIFQVRVWESAFGLAYEDAVANPVPQNGRLALAGRSGIIRVETGEPFPPWRPPGALLGSPTIVGRPLEDGILLTVVPEPRAVWLLSAGVLLLGLRLRRRRKWRQ
jgi:hypothetical protein